MHRSLLAPAALAALAFASAAAAQSVPAADSNAVTGVVVQARRPAVQTLLDRKVYSVTQDLQSTNGTAADVLNNIPSVTVDADGAITLRGDPNVTILVDGKPSAQFSGPAQALSLQQFPAADIDHIEVLTNPPAQYKAEGSAGVINIVTRKRRKSGFSGAMHASLGDKRRFVLGADGAYNNGPLRLSGGIGLRQDAKERLVTSDRTADDPDTGAPLRTVQSIDERFRRLIPSINAGVSYDLTPTQTIDASISQRELAGIRYFIQHDVENPPGQPVDSISNRHSDGYEWDDTDSKSISFEQKLWRPQETLKFTLARSAYRERERYAYTNTYPLPAADPTYDDLHLSLDLIKTEFSADYDLPLPHDRELRLGLDFEHDHDNFDDTGDDRASVSGPPIANPAIDNHFRYRQQIDAAYGDYQTRLGEWRLDAGLRLEAARITTLQIVGEVPGGRDEFGAYPSLHLDRSLGESGKLLVGMSRRITRPDPESLNPWADTQDTHNLRAGNPQLLPQDTWSYEFGYQHDGRLTLGATAYYRFDRNSFTEVVEPVSADVVLTTKANLPKRRSAGLEMTASGRIGPRLRYSLSGNLFYAQIDATELGAGAGLAGATGLDGKASLDYRLSGAGSAQLQFSRTDRRLTPQGYLAPVNQVNLGYRHDFPSNLSLVITVSDLFNGQRAIRHLTTPVLSDVYERYQYGRIAYVGFVYSFGGPKKAKQGFDYDS